MQRVHLKQELVAYQESFKLQQLAKTATTIPMLQDKKEWPLLGHADFHACQHLPAVRRFRALGSSTVAEQLLKVEDCRVMHLW